jgi:hypothetical protein
MGEDCPFGSPTPHACASFFRSSSDECVEKAGRVEEETTSLPSPIFTVLSAAELSWLG